jgi:thymidine phosphorylase
MSRKARQLKLRRVCIDTYRENVAYLHRDCPTYRAEGFQALSKIEVAANGHRILAVLNVVDDARIVAPGELGLSQQAWAQFDAREGAAVAVRHAEPPASMDAVRRRIAGEKLSEQEFGAIIRDISDNRYSKTEISAFLVATGQIEMDRDEVLYLTRAMIDSGERLDWNEPLVADKHCIGGIPGNRTSLLVVPIAAAHGMLIPKTSSRAITSPSGTADTMEVLARVELPIQEVSRVVRKERGCTVWGGTARLSPADDVLIAVERPLSIDSQGQMVASILSKKVAAGSTHLLIDIPVGPTAKVRHMTQAQQLKKLFEFVGSRLGIHVQVVITDGRQPIGRGVGPLLEARDVMQVLQCAPEAPSDLRQKALRLAGRIIEFDPDVRGGDGFQIARDILDSGRALAKMNAIVAAQGRQPRAPRLGRLSFEVHAPASGHVTAIDNFQIARIARLAGAPIAKGAGVDLMRRVGDRVRKGEPLYRVFAEYPAERDFARARTEGGTGFTIGRERDVPQAFVEF